MSHPSADEHDSLENVHKQCTHAILRGLRKAPQNFVSIVVLIIKLCSGALQHNEKLEMNYVNYDHVIVLGLQVKLVK